MLALSLMTFSSTSYLFVTCIVGVLLSFALPFRIPAWHRLFFGPALGMIVIAEVTFWIALIFNFNQISVLSGCVVSLLIAAYFFTKQSSSGFPRPEPHKIVRSWSFLLVLLTIGPLVFYIYCTKVLVPDPQGWMIAQGGLFGDTAFHLSQITSFAYQGVPISNPLFAGIPFRYPFLVNFFASCLFRFGMTLRFILTLPQILNFVGVLALLHLCVRRFTDETGTFFTFLIFLLGWGFGFVDYFANAFATGNWAIARDFTNNMQTFRFQNFITGIALPQRGILSGFVLGLLVIVCFLYHEGTLDRKRATWLAIFCGILPLWHVHTFLFVFSSMCLWLVVRYQKDLRSNIDGIVLFVAITLMISIPTMLWFGQQIQSQLRIQAGWLHVNRNQISFWLLNTGLVLPLAFFSIQYVLKKDRWIFLPAFLLFLVGNLLIFQPWEWDNIKLLIWPMLFFSILAGAALGYLFSRGIVFKTITFILIGSLTLSGVLSVLRLTSKDYVYRMFDREDLLLSQWIIRNTSPFSTFLISDTPVHPLSLTGRAAYLGYPGYVWVHGIDYRPRLALEKRILAGDLSAIKELEIPVDYIVAENSQLLIQQNALAVSYRNGKFTVFRLR